MNKVAPSKKIYLSNSTITKAGRGIFASVNILKDEIIETCPVLVFSKKDYPILKQTEMRNYYFMWGKEICAVCFGFGSMYNHSFTPNATYLKNTKKEQIEFIAINNIKKDEEITVNYNYGNPDDKTTLWIKSIPPAKEKFRI